MLLKKSLDISTMYAVYPNLTNAIMLFSVIPDFYAQLYMME